MANPTKTILYVGATRAGSVHDYTLLKQALPPKPPWFKNKHVWLDLGFQGVKTDYAYPRHIQVPHKKPRTSKKNPAPRLTPAQKAQNRAIARVRVAVEHAIGGMKSFHCLAHRIRNHLDTLPDTLVWLCAGLWNMKLVS
jgi:DDE superfamily endonuclease